MVIEKICSVVAKNILSEALNNAGECCVFWHHQPKLPEGIENIQKEMKEKNKLK